MTKETNILKTKIYKILNLWLPVVVWASIIFTFSTFPTVQTTDFFLGDFIIKKTAHIVEYGILATLLYRAFINSNITTKKAMWYAVVAAFLYGVSDEFHQSFTPGRTPTFRDILIDATGASIFVFGIIGNVKKMPQFVQNLYDKYQI